MPTIELNIMCHDGVVRELTLDAPDARALTAARLVLEETAPFVRVTKTEAQELTDLHTLRDATALRARPDVGSSVALCASSRGEWNVRLDNMRLTEPDGAPTLDGALHAAAEICRASGYAR
jgi:hypothetical protein